MSKRKKQQANGFLLFMRDMQMDMRQNGRNVSIRDMPVLAGPKWAKLPDREKAVYNARAKAERRGAGATPGGDGLMYVPPRQGRMDCSGTLLSVRRCMCDASPRGVLHVLYYDLQLLSAVTFCSALYINTHIYTCTHTHMHTHTYTHSHTHTHTHRNDVT